VILTFVVCAVYKSLCAGDSLLKTTSIFSANFCILHEFTKLFQSIPQLALNFHEQQSSPSSFSCSLQNSDKTPNICSIDKVVKEQLSDSYILKYYRFFWNYRFFFWNICWHLDHSRHRNMSVFQIQISCSLVINSNIDNNFECKSLQLIW